MLCSKCKIQKHHSAFNKNSYHTRGYQYWCRDCRSNWYGKNAERKRQNVRRYRQKLRDGVFEKLGGECNYCGFSDYRALQVDHVNGGGVKEQNRIGHSGILRKIRDLEDCGEYQLLCANCNWIKRHTRGEQGVRK